MTTWFGLYTSSIALGIEIERMLFTDIEDSSVFSKTQIVINLWHHAIILTF